MARAAARAGVRAGTDAHRAKPSRCERSLYEPFESHLAKQKGLRLRGVLHGSQGAVPRDAATGPWVGGGARVGVLEFRVLDDPAHNDRIRDDSARDDQ